MYKNVVISGTGIYYPKENAMEYDKIVNHFKSLDIEVEGLLKHLGKKVRFIADLLINNLFYPTFYNLFSPRKQ